MPPFFRFLSLALIFPLMAGAEDPNPAKAEAELKAVRSQIDKVKADMERDAGRRDQLAKELEESEKTVGAARGALDKLRRERATHTARRAELAAERRTEESALAQDREALAGQIRAASMIGRQEPIKLLLNQRDPGQTGRVLVYYQYFGRARASQIAAIDAHLAEINQLDAELAAEEQRLLALEEQQRGEVSKLQSARERRGRALVSLDTESKNRAKELERLKDQQGGLEKLVRELRRALERIEKFPTDSKDAFAKLRGKLAWPASGKLVYHMGSAWDLGTKTGSKDHTQNGALAYIRWGMKVEAGVLIVSALGALIALLKGRQRFAMFTALWALIAAWN